MGQPEAFLIASEYEGRRPCQKRSNLGTIQKAYDYVAVAK
jgi:hypothetical protein